MLTINIGFVIFGAVLLLVGFYIIITSQIEYRKTLEKLENKLKDLK